MKITFLECHSVDHAPGLPIWQYSLPCAYLQAYLTRSEIYGQLTFDRVVDYENASAQRLIDAIIAQRPDVLAASCYTWNWQLFQQVIPAVKQQLKDLIVVAGGPQFDGRTAPDALRATPSIDAIVLGEGEVTFKEIVEYLHARRSPAASPATERRLLPVIGNQGGNQGGKLGLGAILGVMILDEAGVPVTPGNRPVIPDLDDIPSPYLTGVIDLATLKNGMVAIETQRGCPYRCAYCDYPKREFETTRVRYFSEARVYRELDLIYTSKVRQLYLMDATFNSKRQRCKDILAHIVELKARHKSRIAVNTEMFPELLDEEMLLLADAANLNYIEIGIQSMNPAALKLMDRPRKEQKLLEVLSFAIANNVKIVPQLILGLPGDDLEGFFRSFDRIYGLPTVDFQCFKLLALPGTPYRARAEELGLIYDQTPPYEVIETPTFSRVEITRLDAFRKLAQMFLPLRPTLAAIVEQAHVTYHEVLETFLRRFAGHGAWGWPLRSLAEAATVRAVMASFPTHVVSEYGGVLDEQAQHGMADQLRMIEAHVGVQVMALTS